MGIGVKNINLGAKYHDYLKRQVEELGASKQRLSNENVLKKDRYQDYLTKGLTLDEIKLNEKEYNSGRLSALQEKQQDNLNRFTRCSGELANEYGLTGSLSTDKLHTIADLEMGIDPRTKPFVQVKNVQVHTIKDESTAHVIDQDTGSTHYLSDSEVKQGNFINELGKTVDFKKSDIKFFDIKLTKIDLKNGNVKNANGDTVYFDDKQVSTKTLEQRKTATELAFTVDSSFSYLYQTMNDDDKKKFEKIFFESADKAFSDQVGDNFKNSAGEHGKLLTYDVMHLDNRNGLPHIHIHKNISNIMKMPDGSISATELDKIKEKGFHTKVDSIFKADFVEKFKQEFPNIPIETYDKEKKSVLDYSKSRVKDYRVAYDDASLLKIKEQSTIGEQIEKVVDRQKKDENSRFSNVVVDLENQKSSGELSKELFYKKFQKEQQKHSYSIKSIESSKNKAKIQSEIKNKKSDESLSIKTDRLDDFVKSLNLKVKKDGKDIGIIHPNELLNVATDEQIFKNLTATNATFTSNDLITEYVNHYGLDGKSRAETLIENSRAVLNGGSPDLKADMLATFKLDKNGEPSKELIFTTKSLVSKEFQNIEIMRKQLSQKSNMHISDIELSKTIETLEKKLNAKFVDGQKDLIKATFNNSNACIAIGVPGAGKSFAINGCALIAHEQGFKTFAVAPTNKVAGDLGQTAIGKKNAFTVQKFNADIEKGNIQLDSKSIVFMDEASMIATNEWNSLLKNIDKSGAKLVVVGDTNQISAVGTGATLTEFMRDSEIIKHTNSIVVLDEITRQKDEISKLIANSTSLAKEYKNGNVETLKASGDHIREAFSIMESNDRVNKFDTTDKKIIGLVNDYMQDKNNAKDKLVLASTNESVNLLNKAIQDARVEKGELSKQTASNGDKTFYIGDRIVVKDNNKGDKPEKELDKALFTEFSQTQEQKQAYKDFKSNKVLEPEFKRNQKNQFAEFKASKEKILEKQTTLNFEKTKAFKNLQSEFKQGKIDKKDFAEQVKVNFTKYKIENNLTLTGGYSNGDVGTIKEFHNGIAIVDFDNGTVNTVKIERNDKVDLGYALTLHKSQGQTVQNSYVFMESSSINNQNLCNVAFTRMKEDLQVYSTNSEYNQVKEQFARQDAKQLLTEIGKQYGINPHAQAQQQQVEPPKPLVKPQPQQEFMSKAKDKLQILVKNIPAKKPMPTMLKVQQQQQHKDMPDAIKAQKAQEYLKQQELARQQILSRNQELQKAHDLQRINDLVKAQKIKKQKEQSLSM